MSLITGDGSENNPYVVDNWDDILLYAADDGKYVEVVPNTEIDMLDIFPDGVITTPILTIHSRRFNGNGLKLKNLYGSITSGNVSDNPIILAGRTQATLDVNYISGIHLTNFYIINRNQVPVIRVYVTGNSSQNTYPYYLCTDMEFRGYMSLPGETQYNIDGNTNSNFGQFFKSLLNITCSIGGTEYFRSVGIRNVWDSSFVSINVNGRFQNDSNARLFVNSYVEGHCEDNTTNTSSRTLNLGKSVASIFNVEVDANEFVRENQIYANSETVCCLINNSKIDQNASWNIGSGVIKMTDAELKSFDDISAAQFPVIQEVST